MYTNNAGNLPIHHITEHTRVSLTLLQASFLQNHSTKPQSRRLPACRSPHTTRCSRTTSPLMPPQPAGSLMYTASSKCQIKLPLPSAICRTTGVSPSHLSSRTSLPPISREGLSCASSSSETDGDESINAPGLVILPDTLTPADVAGGVNTAKLPGGYPRCYVRVHPESL